jgi:hypothetical protein
MADTAMPISMPGRASPMRPNMLPKAMTIGNVIGNSHTAGGPSWAPHKPTAIIART